MADWGLYSALQGKDNWAQRRQDKAMNLQIVQAQAADEEKKVQKSMAAEQEINKYFDEIASMDVLEADKSRIEELEKKARQNIIQGIAQNNGDLTRYASSGGMTDLGEYKRSIIQSQEVKDAMNNKMAMGAYLADAAKGNRYFNKVEADIPMIGEDGEQMLDENGNVKVNRKMVDFKDAARLHKEGKINRLTYNGSENIVKLNPAMFKQYFKDPKNPYSKDNIVTASDVKFQSMEMGASEAQATDLARNYVNMVDKGGDSWKWNSKSELDYQNDMDTIEKKRQSSSGSGSGSGKTMTQDSWYPSIVNIPKGGNRSLFSKEKTPLFQTIGLNPIKESERGGQYNYQGQAYGSQNNTPIDISKAEIYDNDRMRYVNRNGEYGLMMQVSFDNDDSTIAPGLIFNTDAIESENKNFVDRDNKWIGEVWVPLNKYLSNQMVRQGMNEHMNYQDNSDFTAARGGNVRDAMNDQDLRLRAEEMDKEKGLPLGTTYSAYINGTK